MNLYLSGADIRHVQHSNLLPILKNSLPSTIEAQSAPLLFSPPPWPRRPVT